jgi:hypothetical protein
MMLKVMVEPNTVPSDVIGPAKFIFEAINGIVGQRQSTANIGLDRLSLYARLGEHVFDEGVNALIELGYIKSASDGVQLTEKYTSRIFYREVPYVRRPIEPEHFLRRRVRPHTSIS